jgi:hypothetical protein
MRQEILESLYRRRDQIRETLTEATPTGGMQQTDDHSSYEDMGGGMAGGDQFVAPMSADYWCPSPGICYTQDGGIDPYDLEYGFERRRQMGLDTLASLFARYGERLGTATGLPTGSIANSSASPIVQLARNYARPTGQPDGTRGFMQSLRNSLSDSELEQFMNQYRTARDTYERQGSERDVPELTANAPLANKLRNRRPGTTQG